MNVDGWPDVEGYWERGCGVDFEVLDDEECVGSRFASWDDVGALDILWAFDGAAREGTLRPVRKKDREKKKKRKKQRKNPKLRMYVPL